MAGKFAKKAGRLVVGLLVMNLVKPSPYGLGVVVVVWEDDTVELRWCERDWSACCYNRKKNYY